jgi:hypothetical protein
MKKQCLAIFMIFSMIFSAAASDFTQAIRGQIIDKQSNSPLPGANIIVKGTDPLIGTSTDVNGFFELREVPVGRVNLQVSFMGYIPVTIPNLNLTAGKEIVINIEMEEEVYTANEVVITASQDKTKPINEMSSVSARTFSVEESQRFAGARNDVARMAMNYAGVSSGNDAVNDIVIRGNSPNGLLWRLEGVEIPNPNHFGQVGATGGPVSMLNNNVLDNSDFMTGAFPAQYGNAVSGVFDLNMRTGNYENYEFLAQVGFNGFEFGVEGPVSRKSNSSFLANYRYSTLGLMSSLGFDFGTGTAIPYYQDVTFKMDLPTRRAGKFTVFGLAGSNKIDFINSDIDSVSATNDDLYSNEDQDIYSRARMVLLGASHTYLINSSTYTKVTIAANYQQQKGSVDSIVPETYATVPWIRRDLQVYNLMASAYINKKFSPRNTLRVGFTGKRTGFDMIDSLYFAEDHGLRNIRDENGATWYTEAYAAWTHKFNDMLVLNAGLHYQNLLLNSSQSLEPRLGLRWTVVPRHTLSFGYGMHSMAQMPQLYFLKFRRADGSYYKPNEELDFTRAHHLVLGYDYNISETLRLKVEGYYQHLYDAPVEKIESSFSMLNFSSMQFETPDSLRNGGPGRNYGLEITLEKFLDRGLYFLVTGSLFDSKYEGSDGVKRSTAFDNRYVANVVAGKEFELKSKKADAKTKKWIVADLKVTAAGGQRYTPLDLDRSIAEGRSVYREDIAYSEQFRDYFRMDLRVAYRMDFKNASQEFAVDIQNLTNHQNPLYLKYNSFTQEEQIVYQIGIIPMMQYRVVF